MLIQRGRSIALEATHAPVHLLIAFAFLSFLRNRVIAHPIALEVFQILLVQWLLLLPLVSWRLLREALSHPYHHVTLLGLSHVCLRRGRRPEFLMRSYSIVLLSGAVLPKLVVLLTC